MNYKLILDRKVPIISTLDFSKYGCPKCNHNNMTKRRSSFGNIENVYCDVPDCGQDFIIVPTNFDISNIGFELKEGEITTAKEIKHPNPIEGKEYIAPDIRPEQEGEFFNCRGIGYDLAGFVKSKKAGERIVQMLERAVKKHKNNKMDSFLDFREHAPNYIQVKIKLHEFDAKKLQKLIRENNNIITQDIVDNCVKVGAVFGDKKHKNNSIVFISTEKETLEFLQKTIQKGIDEVTSDINYSFDIFKKKYKSYGLDFYHLDFRSEDLDMEKLYVLIEDNPYAKNTFYPAMIEEVIIKRF